MPANCPIDLAGPALLPEWRYKFERWWDIYNYYDGIDLGRTSTPPEGMTPDENGDYRDMGSYIVWRLRKSESIQHGAGNSLMGCTFSEDGRMTRAWVDIGSKTLRFRALLLGRAMSDVKWTAELDTPPLPPEIPRTLGEMWPGGVDVEDEGHSLLIRVHDGNINSVYQYANQPWAATLTLKASAGGKDVGDLRLHIGWYTARLAMSEQNEEQYEFNGWEGWQPSDK